LQQLEHGRRAQLVTGDPQRGREGRDEVLAQPVREAALVAGDRARLAGQLAVGHQRPQAGVAVKRQQAADAGVFGVVLLARGAAAPGDEVGVDRQHHKAGVDQPLDRHAVAGLHHDTDLGRVGFQLADLGQQSLDRRWGVLDPADGDHPLAGPAQGDEVELLGPVDPNPQHHASLVDDPGAGTAPC